MVVIRLLAAFSLTILPGAWLAFANRGTWLPVAARVAAAGALSPAVVVLEFLALRMAGLQPSSAAWVTVGINLPAAWLMLRHRTGKPVGRSAIVQSVFVVALLVAGVSIPFHVDPQLRMFESHTWLHSGMVNEFVSGAVLPEEPELAGVRLAYPWVAHVYWATLGTVLDWAPTRVYVLTNWIWIVWTAIGIFAAGVAFGARGFASRAGILWVTLGTNAVGAAIWWATNWLPGDIRYTPWLRKYTSFNDMPFALALLAVLLALAILAVRHKDGRHAGLLAAILGAAGAIYPLILPGALAVAGLVPIVLWFEMLRGRGGTMRQVLVYAGGVVLGTLCAVGVLNIIVAARANSGVELSSMNEAISKLASAVIVLAPFLAAVVVVAGGGLAGRWRGLRLRGVLDLVDAVSILLLLATLATVVAEAMFHLQGSGYNEYKLIICSALILVPFASLAVDRLTPSRVPATLVVVLTGAVLSPILLAQNPWASYASIKDAPMGVEDGRFLHLAAGAVEAGWTDAIRTGTPSDTIVVAAGSEIFVPAATGRSLYAPVVDMEFPGYWLESRDHMIELRGYPAALVNGRVATAKRLFTAASEDDVRNAWTEVAGLGRPVAVLAFADRSQALLAWLDSQHKGRRLFQDDSGRVVWFMPATSAAAGESLRIGVPGSKSPIPD